LRFPLLFLASCLAAGIWLADLSAVPPAQAAAALGTSLAAAWAF
jgi:hypothetical protein